MISLDNFYKLFFLYFRTKRMKLFWDSFGMSTKTSVLDVGGTFFNWTLLPDHPKLTMINISKTNARESGIVDHELIADGRFLPFKDQAFDIVYSNSVIEHLSTLENQRGFATECQRVGKNYYIQTPNKTFPVEPHYIALGIHWLPKALQRHLIRNFTLRGLIDRPSQQECEMLVEEIRLLNQKEIQQLFPRAALWRERLFGFTKSFIAVSVFNGAISSKEGK